MNMLSWLSENIGTIIVCLVLIAIVALVVRSMIRKKKNGCTSCSCGCSGCAAQSKCNK
jgi:cell division protein FtsW (lipid II flippase)